QNAEGLTTAPRQVTAQGGHYYVRLGDDGTGLHAAPRSTPPAGRAGLKLWLNAGAGAASAGGTPASDGTAVQSWRDQSDHAHLATQASAANMPTYVASVANLNHQPALSFDGNDSLGGTLAEFATNPNMSVFVVWDRDGTGTQAPFAIGSSTSAHGSIGVGWNSAGHYNIFQWSGPEGRVYSTAAEPLLETALRNTADGNRMSVFLNGQAGTLSQTGADANVNGAFKIGQHGHTGLAVIGKIAEVLFYDRVLNTAERIVTENYLGAKYAIPLHASSSRFSYAAPEKGDYDFDLIGIGREADGALTAGSAAGLAISEWNGGLSNGDYLLAAHKTTVNGLVATRLPADMRWRWDRVWAMEMTGEADAVLSFDFTDLLAGLPESSLAALVDGSTALGLLYTATDGGDFARLDLYGAVEGDVVSFNMLGSQWADGYYTIGFIPEPSAVLLAMLGLLSFLSRRARRANA
ncbi:MAG: PEP-CTERM sorting domain-containing protein, partial [Patescibacteria group bacterium]|nr:PEP-CTERM sorting domain-containing protein [Patescibacteria group bacterium]